MRIEHIHVSNGGQAVVGNVGPPQAVDQTGVVTVRQLADHEDGG